MYNSPTGRPRITTPQPGTIASLLQRITHHCSTRKPVEGFAISDLSFDKIIDLRSTDAGLVLDLSILDLGCLIEKDDPYDQIAKSRVGSYYTNNYTNNWLVSMFDKDLIQGPLSFSSTQWRPAITFSFLLDASHSPGQVEIWPSRAKITKPNLFPAYNGSNVIQDSSDCHLTETIDQFAQSSFATRVEKGALAFVNPTQGIYTKEDGIACIYKPRAFRSIFISREIEIRANLAFARYMIENEVPLIFLNNRGPHHLNREMLGLRLAERYKKLEAGIVFDAPHDTHTTIHHSGYSVDPQGHFALNVPHFAHVTAPLSRYIDLLNCRNLGARIRGEAIPHDREDLSHLCDLVNHHLEMQDAALRHQRFTNSGIRELIGPTKSAGNHIRSGDDLTSLICLPITNDIEDRIRKMIASDTLSLIATSTILFEPESDISWKAIRFDLASWVACRPTRALGVILNWQDRMRAPSPFIVQDIAGERQNPKVRLFAALKLGDQEHSIEPLLGRPRSYLMRLAAAALIAKIFNVNGLALSPPKEVDRAKEPTQSQGKSDLDYRQLLVNLCSQAQIEAPTLNVVEFGTRPNVKYLVTAKLNYLGKGIHSELMEARDAKVGKDRAFEMLYVKVEKVLMHRIDQIRASSLESRPVEFSNLKEHVSNQPSLPLSNPGLILRRFTWATEVVPPSFALYQHGENHSPIWEATAAITIGGKSFMTKSCFDTNTVRAKKRAALELLKLINSHKASAKIMRSVGVKGLLDAIGRRSTDIEFSQLRPTEQTAVMVAMKFTDKHGNEIYGIGRDVDRTHAVRLATRQICRKLGLANDGQVSYQNLLGNYALRNSLLLPTIRITRPGSALATKLRARLSFSLGGKEMQSVEGFGANAKEAKASLLRNAWDLVFNCLE